MPDTNLINPSPKSRFMAVTAFVKTHRDLMQHDDLQRSLDYALMEYSRQLCELPSDVNSAAANHFRMLGAHDFIKVLKTLAESVRIPPAPSVVNLDHNA